MFNIDWSKIKDGATGFENLAREYVKDEFDFPNGTWVKTEDTHDGNKDAYTIIIGFHPFLDEQEVWWMEAKYSTKKVYLSRFRLDATIVSSIFNRSIKKIIFVTNIDIKAKVISDIRMALYKGTSCEEAYFCTKKVLEFWLYNNPVQYKSFFDGELPQILNIPELFVSEDMTVYSASNAMRETEPLLNIASNKTYQAHFKLISNCNQIIKIKSAQRGIKRLSDISFTLVPGENSITVPFMIEDKYFTYKKRSNDGTEEYNLCFFKVNGKVSIVSKLPIAILKNQETHLSITSQLQFEKEFDRIKHCQDAYYIIVDGKQGSGKTTVVQHSAEKKLYEFGHYHYLKFVDSSNSNNHKIVSALFFVLFPYIYFEDIDVSFIDKVVIDSDIRKLLSFLLNNVDNGTAISKHLKTYDLNSIKFFFSKINIRSKIVILDDIHLLGEENFELLFFLLFALQKTPIIFVLIGDSYLLEQTYFNEKCKCLYFNKYHFELALDDILNNIRQVFSFSFELNDAVIEFFFPNIVIFNSYILYVEELSERIKNIDDFIVSYISFKQNNISHRYINRQFMYIYKMHPSAWTVCADIYNKQNGLLLSEDYNNEIRLLIRIGLIKYNEANKLIPVNDIYFSFYRKEYQLYVKTDNPLVSMMDGLTNALNGKDLEEYYTKIQKMRESENFYTINYILEPIFENYPISNYLEIWGNEMFYLLYYEYTYAAINCNSNITGYDYLQTIYRGIKGTSSKRLQNLGLEVIFELINCDYNKGDYANCKKYFNELNDKYKSLKKMGMIHEGGKSHLFYTLGNGYMILIDSEENHPHALYLAEQHKNLLKKMYPHHYIDFCKQFANTLYVKNWDLACEWIAKANDALSTDGAIYSKQYCKVKFQFYYVNYLNEAKNFYLDSMKDVLIHAKACFYSSYRHMLFLYCVLLYFSNSIDEADTLFFKDIVNTRPVRKKMKGHYYELLTLHYLKHHDLINALESINKSVQIFEGMKDYYDIAAHNSSLIKKQCSIANFSFYIKGTMENNVFYIDPRI